MHSNNNCREEEEEEEDPGLVIVGTCKCEMKFAIHISSILSHFLLLYLPGALSLRQMWSHNACRLLYVSSTDMDPLHANSLTVNEIG